MNKKVFIISLASLLLAILIGVIVILSVNKEEPKRYDTISSFDGYVIDSKNDYSVDYDFNYVSVGKRNLLRNKYDLFDLYFNVVNSGIDSYTFYCPTYYEDCIKDVVDLANNPNELSIINGFVHPYNSFNNIETSYYKEYIPFRKYHHINLYLNKVVINIRKTYSNEDIDKLNYKIDEIVDKEVKNEKDVKKIIRIIHDFIINNTKYDRNLADRGIIEYKSSVAYGPLLEGYGICGGYADAMALFLNYYNIPNYRVNSDNHIWNAVYVDGEWLHLDLLWDDPIISTGEDILDDSYFLITTSKLMEYGDYQHSFDRKVFSELAY